MVGVSVLLHEVLCGVVCLEYMCFGWTWVVLIGQYLVCWCIFKCCGGKQWSLSANLASTAKYLACYS